MASLNKVFLIGNLTKQPELRYTPSGTAVADLRLAVNRNYTTQGGDFLVGRTRINDHEYLVRSQFSLTSS